MTETLIGRFDEISNAVDQYDEGQSEERYLEDKLVKLGIIDRDSRTTTQDSRIEKGPAYLKAINDYEGNELLEKRMNETPDSPSDSTITTTALRLFDSIKEKGEDELDTNERKELRELYQLIEGMYVKQEKGILKQFQKYIIPVAGIIAISTVTYKLAPEYSIISKLSVGASTLGALALLGTTAVTFQDVHLHKEDNKSSRNLLKERTNELEIHLQEAINYTRKK